MKKEQIYPNDWLELHPYKKTNQIDVYYTDIANRISNIMYRTEFASSFTNNDVKVICMRMAAYFEDVISQTGIWQTFTSTHKELFGSFLPFYSIGDDYYTDEVNLEDIRFLLWHYTQQYYGFSIDTFINPDNPSIEETAQLIYNLFRLEWEDAPENDRLLELFSASTRYESPEQYEVLLFWFHYNSYLFTDNDSELTELMKALWEEGLIKRDNIEHSLIEFYQKLAYTGKTALLALTSPQWLSRILPETHPDNSFLKAIAEKAVLRIPDDEIVRNQEVYYKFTQASGGDHLVYFSNAGKLSDYITKKIGLTLDKDKRKLVENAQGKKALALYATPKEGLQILYDNLESIKDKKNPFYNQELARDKAVSFYLVKHCSIDLLKILHDNNMLVDAQIKYPENPKRGKDLVTDNFRFLTRYFTREYPMMS